MKFKSIANILSMLAFIMSIAEVAAMLMRLELPEIIITIIIIFLFVASMSEFVETRKLRKLVYPIITIYFFIIMPFIGEFIHNKIQNIVFAVLSFFITMIFLYRELMLTSKEKGN
ncbi:hypothetical protein [Clostridium scatologenes]|uniref:Uncharacterized protein n=1 Tax=Clostridium scatologenes TaxID=1548 RepID=A0A0E3M553_CLOSL|nr:hypothetical protein [Clostridium scatologenes]AKA67775.1 hypothetical protein CSCA_0650 [Clostridium scatologenes]